MAKANLPKTGDRLAVNQFHVSEANVRADLPFGDSPGDQSLLAQLRKGDIVQPFKARPEDDGYGVYMGRRRFLAKKQLGAKTFTVGKDVLITNTSDDEARETSWIENLAYLKEDMDPITRAEGLAEILSNTTISLRGLARRYGISPATLSEWYKVLSLSPKMQDCVRKGLLYYTDAMNLARMDLGDILQDELAETLQSEGYDAFKNALAKHTGGRLKRGIPAGKYIIDRLTWDKRYKPDMQLYQTIEAASKAKNMKTADYLKDFIKRHITLIEDEAR